MAVTIDGQKGYDYQHIATTFYALQQIDAISSGWIEAPGHEDAYFELSANGSLILAEVQVKKRKKRLALSDIAEMLCHFEEQSVTRCLIARMMNNPQLHAYFITSTSITEEVGKLSILSNKDSFSHIQFKPTKAILKLLALELGKVTDKSKTLAPARGAFCRQLSGNLSRDIDQLRSVMARCFLVEGMTESDLLHRIDLLLANQHKVSSSSRPVVSNRLIKLVNEFKGESGSFLPAFKTTLRRQQVHLPSLSSSYIPRPDEAELKAQLLKDGYLLLSGPSFCGKSDTARSISWSLVLSSEMISDYSNSIDAAEAFLLSAGNEERLFLLDDPLGHLPEAPIGNQLLKLHNLIRRLPGHTRRYLIVTSNERVLQTALSGPKLSWRNLIVGDRGFLELIWMKLTDNGRKVVPRLFDAVNEFLKGEPAETLLQPGHLDYLVNSAPDVKMSDPTAIRNYAYIDAERIMLEIPVEFKRDFAILSCLTSTISSVPIMEVAFVSDEAAEEQPGLLSKPEDIGSNIKKKKDGSSFPAFEKKYDLLPAQLNALDYFEDRGYIAREDGQYRFRHPIYLQAARLCLVPFTGFSHQDIKQMLIRSLSTVNYDTANNAINTIGLIVQLAAATQQSSFLRYLLDVAEVGLRSIFPSIQDQSFYILLQYYDQLRNELQETIQKKINYHRQDIGNIKWHNGIPYISKREIFLTRTMGDLKPVLATAVHRTAIKLGSGVSVSPKQTWEYLEYLEIEARRKKSRITADVAPLKKALLFNESFIKESAAYLLAASITDNEIELLENLFREHAPPVLFSVLKGAWRAYPYFATVEAKAKVSQWIMSTVSKKWISLRSIDLITQFDIGYSAESFDWMYEIEEEAKPDMWDMWARVTPIVLANLPITVNYHAPRFTETLKTAIKELPVSANLKIVQSWVDWVKKFPDQHENRKRHFENLLDYFCLFILQLPVDNRLPIIDDLTSANSSFLRGMAFRYIQLFWEMLTLPEQNLLLLKLKAEDQTTQVIVLTGVTNADIQTAICGQALDKEDVLKTVSVLGEERLLKCLTAIYFEFNVYDIDYADYGFWNDILHFLLRQAGSLASHVAIYQLVKKYMFANNGKEQLKWRDVGKTIIRIYTNGTAEVKDKIAAVILYYCDWIDYLSAEKLSSLFAALTEADKVIFTEKMIGYVEILSAEKISDLSEELNVAITKYLQDDAHVITILSERKADIIQTADTCLGYFEKGTIRTKIAFEYFEKWLQTNRSNISVAYNERFQKTRAVFDELGKLKYYQLHDEVYQQFEKFMLS